MIRKRILLLIMALILCLAVSCGDDDPSASSGQADDDNDDTPADDDDDDSLTDDDTVDDDTADDDDDDTSDDDDDDDTGPTYLMVLGENDDGYVSYRQTDAGWLEQAIPAPSSEWSAVEFGPLSFADGEQGYGVWNRYLDLATAGHSWLDYDPDAGWSMNIWRPQAHLGAIVTDISTYAAGGNLWASSYRWQVTSFDNYLYRFCGDTPEQLLSGHRREDYTTLYFFDADNGYVAGNDNSGAYLVRYSAGEWQWVGMPAGFDENQFYCLELFDMENGFGIATSNNDVARLLRMTDGIWTPVLAPSGCGVIFPEAVIGDENHAVAFRYSRAEDRFWEYQDGQWTCRLIDVGAGALQIIHAAVWRDGRLFIVGLQEGIGPVAYEVHSATVTEVELPPELIEIYAVFAIGSQAPRQANWRLTF